ncbi:MAG: imelysin family protein [Flavobacteriales bacterium]
MKKIVVIFPLIILLSYSCKKDKNDGVTPDFDKKSLLTNYGNNLIVPRYQALSNSVIELETAINTFVTSTDSVSLVEARKKFLTVYSKWQACSSFEFGPAKNNTLKSVLNIYPTDTTQINNNIQSGSYVLGAASNINAIGLPAIDFLLNSRVSISKSLTYFAAPNRKQYLQDLTTQIKNTVNSVLSAWKGSYLSTFINSDGTSNGSSMSLIVNELNFDFEKFIRDGKVGIPLGVRSLGTPLPEKSEAYFGKNSTELCKESILKLKEYFNGGTGQGLDDYLNHLEAKHGSQPLASKINSQFNLISTKLNALSGPISEQVISNQSAVQEVYDEMQKMIVLLKVDLSSALSILITYQDNDGD